jgi:ATP-binding cassette subfamily B (MDR/TAP) protein 1
VIAQEAISSIKTIHAFGAQDRTIRKYDDLLADAHKEAFWKSPVLGVFFSVSTFLVMSGTALAFWEGHRMYANGEIRDVGTVFTVVLSVTLGATSIMTILPTFSTITNASSAASELFEVLDKPSKLDPLDQGGIQPESCAGSIEMRGVSFAYPSRPTATVLDGMNLVLPVGKTTALVGASGSGKSTVIGLLERWYEPSEGSILIDGVDIAEYNVRWLRSKIRLVQQEPTLFQGTIYENVAKGFVDAQRGLSYEKQKSLVEEACKSSNAHQFIMQLPDGYQTEVGERAGMLSGGQRQRISIARSIISDPKVLLLDEATSALDTKSEGIVQAALNRVSANKTTLIIAHKLATVQAADSIAVMANGKIVEQGSHKTLLEQDGLYAAMVRAQDLGDHNHESEPRRDGLEEKSSASLAGMEQVYDTEKLALSQQKVQRDSEQAPEETIGMPLWKCILVMLGEHRQLWPYYLVISIGCLIGGGTYPAQAIIFSRLIHVYSLTGAEAQQQADFYALMFFVLALANLFGKFGIGWCCNLVGQTMTHHYRREMFENMLYQDQDFFDRRENTSGALTSKLSSIPSALQELMSANLGLILNVTVNILSSSIVGIAFGWKLGLTVVFGGITVIMIAGYIRIRLDQRLDVSTGRQFAASAGVAAEAVNSIRAISSLTLEPLVLQQYNDAMESIVSQVTRSLAVVLIPYAISQSVDFLVMALGFWYGSTLIASGEYTSTQFFVVFLAIVFGGQGAAQFFGYTTSITRAKVAANYMFWLRQLQPEIRETNGNRDIGPSGDDGAVAFDKVEFQYKQRNASKVLHGISLTIEPGTNVAFVGPSGCGKSTVISLLDRLYNPTSGRITFNGTDVSDMSPKRWRHHLSLVQQEPPLFSGSVHDNIALGLEREPSEDEVLEACKKANALDFVTSLPEGLGTNCGSSGLQFSGGQRQRIAIARALIRDPRILLLDEATSALDTQTEREVQRVLQGVASGRTTIAVAHRLSTIRHSNAILVMENGRIEEFGTHEELQRLRGRYYAMCLAQSLDQNWQ